MICPCSERRSAWRLTRPGEFFKFRAGRAALALLLFHSMIKARKGCKAEGGDLVLLDGDDLAERLRARVGEAPVPLALDAVGGAATQRLADCLSDGGTVVNYGFLSGAACRITPDQTILHDIRLRGFWLAGLFRRGDLAELTKLYQEITRHLRDGSLAAPIEAVYPIEQIKQAVAHAHREGRDGKILVLPNGPLVD